MPVPQKFEKKDLVPIDGGTPKKFDVSQTMPSDVPEEYATNPGGEGTYQMVGKKGERLYVPFSHVLEAGKFGFEITPDDFSRFTKDYAWSQGPRAVIDRNLAPEDESTWAGKGLNIFKGTGAGLTAPILHPKETAHAMGANLLAGGAVASGPFGITGPYVPEKYREINDRAVHGAQDETREQAEEMGKHPVYATASVVGPAVVTAGAEHFVPKIPGAQTVAGVVKGLPESIRTGIRDTMGATENTEKTVAKYGRDLESTRDKNVTASEKTIAKRGAVDEANKTGMEKHRESVDAHADRVRKMREAHEKKVAERNKKNADLLMKHQEDTRAVQQENAQTLQEHLAEVQKTAQENEGLRQSFFQRQRLEQEVQADSAELAKRIDDAQKDAGQKRDAKWDDVRAKTAGGQADIQPIKDVVDREAAKADPATSAVFKSILAVEDPAARPVVMDGAKIGPQHQAYNQVYEATYGEPPPMGGPGGKIDFDRLQRWYSWIGNKMYGGGRLEGGIFNAYKNVRNAIDKAMQQIAKDKGATADLDEARQMHEDYMETFSDSPNQPQTVASSFKKEVAPEFTKEELLTEKAKKLARYDKNIAALGEKLTKARDDIKTLPDEEAARRGQKVFPNAPEPKPLPDHPELHPDLEAPEYPEAPAPFEPKPYEEPETNTPLPETPNLYEENLKTINDQLRRYGKVGAWVLRLIVGGAQKALSHEHVSVFSQDILIGQIGVTLLTHALRSEKVLDWIAKPGAEDLRMIDQLPPADAERVRQALGAIVQEELKQHPEKANDAVDPTIAAFLGGQGASQSKENPKTLDELKKEAEQRKPQQQAAPATPPPGPQSSYTHYFDPATGKILPVAS